MIGSLHYLLLFGVAFSVGMFHGDKSDWLFRLLAGIMFAANIIYNVGKLDQVLILRNEASTRVLQLTKETNMLISTVLYVLFFYSAQPGEVPMTLLFNKVIGVFCPLLCIAQWWAYRESRGKAPPLPGTQVIACLLTMGAGIYLCPAALQTPGVHEVIGGSYTLFAAFSIIQGGYVQLSYNRALMKESDPPSLRPQRPRATTALVMNLADIAYTVAALLEEKLSTTDGFLLLLPHLFLAVVNTMNLLQIARCEEIRQAKGEARTLPLALAQVARAPVV